MKREKQVGKPTAAVTIEPLWLRTVVARDHSITVTIRVSEIDSRHADRHYVARVVRRSLAAFSLPDGEGEQRVDDIILPSRLAKGIISRAVVGVEAVAVWRGRPGGAGVEELRAVLMEAGYRVTIEEKRECAEPACLTDAMVDWNRPSKVPPGWSATRSAASTTIERARSARASTR